MVLHPGRQRLSATPIIAKGLVCPLPNRRASKSATHGFASKSATHHMMRVWYRCRHEKTRKTEISRDFSVFFDPMVFRNFVDAFPRFAHLFGSVDRFEPAKCIFCYRFPTEAKLWTDSNHHTLSEAFQKSFPFKIYLQSHRCKGILDRFELPHLICSQIYAIILVNITREGTYHERRI